MVTFEKIPYLRPDIDALEREMSPLLDALESAGSFEEAYDALLRLEGPRRRYSTLANLSEIHHTMNTEDDFWAQEEAYFGRIGPRWEALCNRLNAALTASPFQQPLRQHLGEEVFHRAEKMMGAFSEDIAPELAEEARLSARYTTLTAGLTAELDGSPKTLGELALLRDAASRESRMKFDLLSQSAYAAAKEELDELYDALVKQRHQIALKLGQSSFTEVAYCRQARTGYGRREAAVFCREVEREITPVVTALFAAQQKRLGYSTLWSCDEEEDFPGHVPKTLGKPPEELFDQVFASLSPESAVFYQELRRHRFHDLETRKGKIRGAYSNFIPNYLLPFVFESFDGSPGSVKTFAHECGHGLHSFLKRGEPFMDNVGAASDLCEIHSMAMEFFIWPHLAQLYPQQDIPAYRLFHLKSALAFLPYGAAVDEFQARIYDEPGLSPKKRRALWQELEGRYLPWRRHQSGGFLEEGRAWQRQTHIYKWPFYYIDYALAQTCALQYHFWNEKDHEAAWASYMTLLRESDSYSFTEALQRAGLASPFQPGTVQEVGRQAMALLEGETP